MPAGFEPRGDDESPYGEREKAGHPFPRAHPPVSRPPTLGIMRCNGKHGSIRFPFGKAGAKSGGRPTFPAGGGSVPQLSPVGPLGTIPLRSSWCAVQSWVATGFGPGVRE